MIARIPNEDKAHEQSLRHLPGEGGFAVTPDVDDILIDLPGQPGPVRALWIGDAGNITVKFWGNAIVVTIPSVPAGTLLPIVVEKVMAATTATSIVAFT